MVVGPTGAHGLAVAYRVESGLRLGTEPVPILHQQTVGKTVWDKRRKHVNVTLGCLVQVTLRYIVGHDSATLCKA